MQTFASGSIFLGGEPAMESRPSTRLTSTNIAVATSLVRRSPTPEQRLWSSILVALYRDIAREGPYLRAYRDARRSQVVLDEVVAALGYPAGSVERLIRCAVGEWQAGQRVVEQILAR